MYQEISKRCWPCYKISRWNCNSEDVHLEEIIEIRLKLSYNEYGLDVFSHLKRYVSVMLAYLFFVASNNI